MLGAGLLLATPAPAWAKGLVGVTISGGDLPRPAVVTAEQIAAHVSGVVWGPTRPPPRPWGPGYALEQHGEPSGPRWTYYPRAGGAATGAPGTPWVRFSPALRRVFDDAMADARAGDPGRARALAAAIALLAVVAAGAQLTRPRARGTARRL